MTSHITISSKNTMSLRNYVVYNKNFIFGSIQDFKVMLAFSLVHHKCCLLCHVARDS